MPTVVDPTLRDSVVAKIRQQYHDYTVMEGDKMPSVRRLPFPDLGLNYISGGGVPWGRMTRFWGGPGSTKSLNVWNLIRVAQNYGAVMNEQFEHQAQIARISGDKKLADQLHGLAENMLQTYGAGLECTYFNIEKQYDPLYVRSLGIDTKRLHVLNSQRIEDIGTQAEELLRAFHVVVFDSCTNAISVEEMNHKDGLYHHPVGVRVFKWNQVLSWLNDRLADDNILIYVDQTRSNIGMGANQKMEQEKAPGGKMMEHNSSLTLHFVKGTWLHRKPDGSLARSDKTAMEDGAFGRTQAAGTEILVQCKKSRVGMGDRTAVLHYDKVSKNFDVLDEYDRLGKYFGVVKRTSASSTWYQLPDGRKVQKLRDHISEDPTLKAAIEDVTLRCAADPLYERERLTAAA